MSNHENGKSELWPSDGSLVVWKSTPLGWEKNTSIEDKTWDPPHLIHVKDNPQGALYLLCADLKAFTEFPSTIMDQRMNTFK